LWTIFSPGQIKFKAAKGHHSTTVRVTNYGVLE